MPLARPLVSLTARQSEESENVQHEVFRTPAYLEAVAKVAALPFIPWRELESKTFLVTGASGLIGAKPFD